MFEQFIIEILESIIIQDITKNFILRKIHCIKRLPIFDFIQFDKQHFILHGFYFVFDRPIHAIEILILSLFLLLEKNIEW